MLRGLPRGSAEKAIYAVLDSIVAYIGTVSGVEIDGPTAAIDMATDDGARMLAMYGNLQVDGRTCALEPCFKPERPVEQQGNRRHSDWVCTACNTMNFARRQECFQCQAPKSGNSVAVEDTAPWIDPRAHQKEQHTTLLVRDIPEHANEVHIRNAFNPFGQLHEVRFVPERCLAFVEFENSSHLQQAMRQAQDRGIRVDGTYVNVTVAKDRGGAGADRGAHSAVEQAMAMAQARAGHGAPNQGVDGQQPMGMPESNFKLDTATGFYFNSETQQYYDEKGGVYYTHKDGKCYYFDPSKADYVECAAIGSTLPPGSDVSGSGALVPEDATKDSNVVVVPKAKKKKAATALGKKPMEPIKWSGGAAAAGEAATQGAAPKPAANSLANFKFEVTNFIKKKDPTPPSSPTLGSLAGVAVSAICYLCNRKFPTQDVLKKHNEFSKLHLGNLAKAAAKERERRAAAAAKA